MDEEEVNEQLDIEKTNCYLDEESEGLHHKDTLTKPEMFLFYIVILSDLLHWICS